jgi:hypothetical protein
METLVRYPHPSSDVIIVEKSAIFVCETTQQEQKNPLTKAEFLVSGGGCGTPAGVI